MDFLNGKIKTLYFKYLAAAFGSALITSIFDQPLLKFFGAEGHTLTLAREYVLPIKFVVPCFLFTQTLAAYLRNDKNPTLATAGVLAGGIFNVFGDYFFVFTCDMGAMGAGLATAIGTVISILVMFSHFFRKKNTLRLVRPFNLFRKFREILVTGFSTFFIDIAMGILTILFNRQIMAYLGTNALSVYGVIVNISTFVQCCAYSVGQASQPIISSNFGAGKGERIRQTLRYAIGTTSFFGIIWTVVCLAIPNQFIHLFMSPTEEVLQIAPAIIRCYGLSFLLMPLNIFSTYYFQALMKPKAAFVVSISRGLIISGILILLLPIVTGANSIWFAMPLTELFVAIYVVCMIARYTKQLSTERKAAHE